jgi:dTDP-4-amino-4,6-dideoxygalactose transaminase
MPEKLALLGGKPIRSRPFTSWPVFGQTEENRLLRVLRSGAWGRLQGREVERFEQRFAEAHGCKHGIAVVNGSVSLRIALLAAGIEAEDEVIVPPYTFLSTATAVIEANAIPVFADISLETFNLAPKAVQAAITPRTKAIIPVHFAGQPAEMDAIMAIARKRKLIVIEDAAHAHGASYRNQPAGSIGHFGSFSFQSSKNMTAGEGGIITTNDDSLAQACRSIQNCGRVPNGIWYEHHRISGNYRLSEFQGAILNCQLDRLEQQTRKRDRNGLYLAKQLAQLPGIFPQFRTPDCTRHSYHLFMMRIAPAILGISRTHLVHALRAEGIPCSPGYGYPLNQQPLFRNKNFGPYLPGAKDRLDYGGARFPNAELLCREEAVWLEQSLFLGTRADIEDIGRAFEKICENKEALNAAPLAKS